MDDVQTIKDRLDIVEFIHEYVPLKQAGANWKAPCPFHGEKTPSFMVSREKQIWHCFGCGKGGDLFSFLEEMEGMSFVETLQVLAQRAGVELSRQVRSSHTADNKSRLREVLEMSTKFFQLVLTNSEAGEVARQYVKRRGVSEEIQQQFQIGYVPEASWTGLTDFLTKKKGFGVEECIAAGVSKRSEKGRVYDAFRGRVMFPLWDVHGSVVGFTGRLLEEKEGVGKYVNTTQTPLFDKSRVVYALHKAKQAAKQAKYFVLVEGQLDVIAAHQAGMTNVVAASGTALTNDHVRLLKRYAPELRMAFDSDIAGERAAKRGIDLAIEAGLEVKVITIPDGAGDDPDDCIQKDPAVWTSAVEQAKPVFEYYIERYVTADVFTEPQKLRQVGDLLAGELARISDPIVADFWAQKVAAALRTDVGTIKDKIVQLQKSARPKTSGQKDSARQTPQRTSKTRTRQVKLSEYVLAMLSARPDLRKKQSVQAQWFAQEHQELYKFLASEYTNGNSNSIEPRAQHNSTIARQVATVQLLADEKLFGFSDEQLFREYATAVAELHKLFTQQQKEVLMQEIRSAEQQGDNARAAELIQVYQQL